MCYPFDGETIKRSLSGKYRVYETAAGRCQNFSPSTSDLVHEINITLGGLSVPSTTRKAALVYINHMT